MAKLKSKIIKEKIKEIKRYLLTSEIKIGKIEPKGRRHIMYPSLAAALVVFPFDFLS